MWELDRPAAPKLPDSYFWTWDHRCNWVLDDPGLQNEGCHPHYLKRPETFIEDYRRLTDLAAGLGVRGISVCGFLRDSHGGLEAARSVAEYAQRRGVALMPLIGTTWYGGAYCEGSHSYNLETFLSSHPDMQVKAPPPDDNAPGLCPARPRFAPWIAEAVRWVFDELPVGGVLLENGDYLKCNCERCEEHRASWPTDDPEIFRMQYLAYAPALEAIADRLDPDFVIWTAYTGFVPGLPAPPRDDQDRKRMGPYLRCARPALLDRLPAGAHCNWTLTQMVRDDLPLAVFLDDGAPAEAFENPLWPANLASPVPGAIGFLHQGRRRNPSQLIVGLIKQACLRGFRSGLAGLGIYGEVSSRFLPWGLNYLAMSHFIHWPEDSLRDFGRKTLGQVLEGPDDGERFAVCLARWDSGVLTGADRADLAARAAELRRALRNDVTPDLRNAPRSGQGSLLECYRFWNWLDTLAGGEREQYTVSFF
jgi:hypothetical protein